MSENRPERDPTELKSGNLSNPAVFLATWGGAGFLPKAPGTWGSFAALPFGWGMHMYYDWSVLACATVLVFFIGIIASNGYLQVFGGDDPAPVVIDEVAGQWLTLLPAVIMTPFSPGLTEYLVGFILFRLFDILKPWPVSWADTHLKGGLGIMLDDIIAGLYGAAFLYLFIFWFYAT